MSLGVGTPVEALSGRCQNPPIHHRKPALLPGEPLSSREEPPPVMEDLPVYCGDPSV